MNIGVGCPHTHMYYVYTNDTKQTKNGDSIGLNSLSKTLMNSSQEELQDGYYLYSASVQITFCYLFFNPLWCPLLVYITT